MSTHNDKYHKSDAVIDRGFIKFILLSLTIIFVLTAGLMVFLGITVIAYYQNFSFFFGYENWGWFLIWGLPTACALFGVILFVALSVGFFGCLKQNIFMVNLYMYILFFLAIMDFTLMYITFAIDSTNLSNNVNVPIEKYLSSPEYTTEIDYLQISLNCCGGISYFDYEHMNFSSSDVTTILNPSVAPVVTPISCCVSIRGEVCKKMRNMSCEAALAYMILDYGTVIGYLSMTAAFMQIFGLLFALYFTYCLRKQKNGKPLIQWTLK